MVRWLMFTQSEARREALLEVILCLPQLPETLACLPILLIFGDITMAYRARVGKLSHRPMYGLPVRCPVSPALGRPIVSSLT